MAAVYRYSEAGLRRLISRAGWQSFVISGAILGGLVGFAMFDEGWKRVVEKWPVYALTGAVLGPGYWFYWRWKTGRDGRNVWIELDEAAIRARGGTIELNLTPGEISAFRRMKDGIYLGGRNKMHSVVLLRELEKFEELDARLEQWVPARVKRVRDRGVVGGVLWLALLGPGVLVLAALSVTDPVYGGVLAAAASAVCGGLGVWMRRSNPAAGGMKRSGVLMLVLALYFAWRTWDVGLP